MDGSSALIRHSIAWPRSRTSSWRSESGSPAAISICSRTRSRPVDQLRDGVLDLDARVHLHEVVGAVPVEQALDRPGGAVADRARGVDRDRADPLAELGVDRGRRRLLDELLVAALDRAVALAEVDRRSRARRRAPAPRRGAGPRGSARRRRSRRRSTPRPRGCADSNARSASSACRTTRKPLPPPPADALIASG